MFRDLKEYQNLLENIEIDKFKLYNYDDTINIFNVVHEIQNDTGFIEKYQYIDWEKIRFLNKSTLFLSILSFYNISAPVLQLIAPVFVLIVPFFVLRVMSLPITWEAYYKILIENIKHHAIGKLFFSFTSASLGQKLYIVFAAGMYLWNIYQNVLRVQS